MLNVFSVCVCVWCVLYMTRRPPRTPLTPILHMASFKDSSLGDSMFLMDLLSAINRGCVNWEMVKGVETDEDRMYNAKYVISVARKLGCAVFLTWEDIVKVRVLDFYSMLVNTLVYPNILFNGFLR